MLFLVLSACHADVHHDLDERAANDVVVALGEYGVVAEKVRGGDGWTIRVRSTQQADALRVLAGLGLPRVVPPELPESGGGLVPSDNEERARRAAQAEQRLAATLSALDGVRDADVHVTLPVVRDRLGGRETVVEARASVVLVHRADQQPPGDDVVRAIATGAVEGLAPDQVAVIRSSVEVPPPRATALEAWGPFVVASSSRVLLQRIFVAGSLLLGLLACLLATQTVMYARRGGS